MIRSSQSTYEVPSVAHRGFCGRSSVARSSRLRIRFGAFQNQESRWQKCLVHIRCTFTLEIFVLGLLYTSETPQDIYGNSANFNTPLFARRKVEVHEGIDASSKETLLQIGCPKLSSFPTFHLNLVSST